MSNATDTNAPEAEAATVPASKQIAQLEAQLALKDRIIAALKNDAISSRAQLENLTERVTTALGGDNDMRAQLKIEMMGYAVLDMVGEMLTAEEWIKQAIGVIEDQGMRIDGLTHPPAPPLEPLIEHRGRARKALEEMARGARVPIVDLKKAKRHVKPKATTSRKARKGRVA